MRLITDKSLKIPRGSADAPSIDAKYLTILSKNTFYFFDPDFEQTYETELQPVLVLLRNLRRQVAQNGIRKEHYIELLAKPNGLMALLILTGFSEEYFKRVITVIRIVSDPDLD